ncbi:MAG: flagellar GTP-binding protein [Planctomycetes bacterium]|nr:flagellar GTP-binding protein [Planctomycetota bacterium]
MKEALARVRSELGAEAVILQSREIKKRRWLGLAGSKWIEITAGAGVAVAEKPPVADNKQDALEPLNQELQALREMVEDLCRRKKYATPDLPEELIEIYTRLIENDVDEAIASELVCQLRDGMGRSERTRPELVRDRLTALVQSRLKLAGPIVCESGQAKVVALVGPTGVGKTATVAKLAANFKLRLNLRVGLVTVDTYRIAAVEQLRTYAEIIDVPLKIATSPREMAAAVGELSGLDLVLVDTAGRSPRDELRIKEIRSLLNEAGATEVHLVLSAVASLGTMLAAVERFSAIDPNRLLVTKLDEANALGGVLSCMIRTGKPISYLTTGQDVPDNIEVADPAELAQRIVDSVWPEEADAQRRAA